MDGRRLDGVSVCRVRDLDDVVSWNRSLRLALCEVEIKGRHCLYKRQVAVETVGARPLLGDLASDSRYRYFHGSIHRHFKPKLSGNVIDDARVQWKTSSIDR